MTLADTSKIASVHEHKEQDKTEKIFHFYENRSPIHT